MLSLCSHFIFVMVSLFLMSSILFVLLFVLLEIPENLNSELFFFSAISIKFHMDQPSLKAEHDLGIYLLFFYLILVSSLDPANITS